MDLLGSITIPRLNSRGTFTPEKPKAVKAKPAPKGKEVKLAPALRDPLEHYIPHARVRYIGRQTCPCCDKHVEFIAGDLLEYSHPENVAGKRTIRTRAFAASDSRFLDLPQRVEYLTEERVTCISCIRLSSAFDEASSGRGQLPLNFEEKTEPASEPGVHRVHSASIKMVRARTLIIPLGGV